MNQLNHKTRLAMIISMISIFALIAVSCDTRNTTGPSVDHEAPPVPTGVTTTTLSQAVIVSWNPIYLDTGHNDLQGFRVFRGLNNQDFIRIATIPADETEYFDEGLQNGTTYYYAVSSFDYSGNESELSYDSAYDTPRPEGENYIYTYTDIDYLDESGFDLSTGTRLPWDHTECDFYLEYDADPIVTAYFLWLGDNGGFIQDMGYTDTFDDITYAPSQGWSNFLYVEAILGHTYVIQTANDHYAKVRISSEFSTPARGIEFAWGYQVDGGNRELKIDPSDRNQDDSLAAVQ